MLGLGVLGGGTMRSVGVRLDAEVGPYIAKLGMAARATKDFGHQFGTVAAQGDPTTKMLGRAGLIAGGVLAGGLALATVAAIQYESAFAGVRKTVDGTDEQLAQISDGIRGMSRDLPASAAEIAQVAEEAGALGVQRGAILGFTRTMIDLGESTNLSATEAAEGIARFSNIMGTPQQEVDRLGSVLVDLGNKMAATEDEILEMGLRIAGAGNQIGLTESDVLAFASSLTSVGINAEAGGSAISRVMADIASDVASGGGHLEEFAQIAGMSAESFTQQWESDPARALTSFITGLDTMQQSGVNVFGVLEQVEFGELRVRDALLRAAGASDMLNGSLDIAATAWDENVALTNEAERRYETTAAKVEIAWNNLQDLGIGLGSQVLPVIARGTELVQGFATGIGNLPGPVKAAGVGLAGIVGAGAGIAGLVTTIGPKLKQLGDWTRELGQTAPTMAAGLRGGGMALGALGVAGLIAIPIIAQMGAEAQEQADQIDLFTQSIIAAEGATDSLDVYRDVAAELAKTDLGTALREAGVDAQVFVEGIASGTTELEEFIFWMQRGPAGSNEFIEGLRSGKYEAGEFTDELLALADAGGDESLVRFGSDVSGLIGNFSTAADEAKNYEHAQEATGEAAEVAADRFDLFAGSAEGAAGATDEMSEAQKRLQQGLETWAEPFAVYNDLLSDKQAKEREAENSTQEMVDGITLTTQEWIAGLEEQATAYDKWEKNLLRIARAGHEDVAAEFAAMGVESADEVEHFVGLTDREMNRVARLLIRGAQRGTEGATQELEIGLALAARAGRRGSRATVEAIAEEFGVSPQVVAGIAAQYPGIILGGVNPVLAGLGRQEIILGGGPNQNRYGRTSNQALGGVLGVGFGQGDDRVDRHVAEIAPAGAMRVWAEPETGGEAYIPLAADRRGRSTAILGEVARLFGYSLDEYARGGFTTGADVPRPTNTIPKGAGPWPGTALNAAEQRLYEQTVKWVNENAAPALGPGIGWEAQWAAVSRQFPGAVLASGFRPGSITSTGNLSYHARGRAIDIGPDNDPFLMGVLRWISQHYGPATQELIFTPAGGEQLMDGHSHVYSGVTAAEHYDHVHWAMAHGGILGGQGVRPFGAMGHGGLYAGTFDQGGWLPPGLTMAYNGTGMPERVTAPSRGKQGQGPPVAVTVAVNAPNYVGDVNDLTRGVIMAMNDPNVSRELEGMVARLSPVW